jgi:hypothetical protein
MTGPDCHLKAIWCPSGDQAGDPLQVAPSTKQSLWRVEGQLREVGAIGIDYEDLVAADQIAVDVLAFEGDPMPIGKRVRISVDKSFRRIGDLTLTGAIGSDREHRPPRPFFVEEPAGRDPPFLAWNVPTSGAPAFAGALVMLGCLGG